MRFIFAVATVAIVGGLAYMFWPAEVRDLSNQPTETASSIALVDVVLPDTLSDKAQIGKTVFEAKCASCHGINAAGQDEVAPPLVHEIYEIGHHGDESFQRAVAMGVPSHHWPFGDMLPVEGLTRGDVKMVVVYIRELQRANGIN